MKEGKNKRRFHAHFVAIGGIGMSALARWFLAQNWAVSGSDIAESSITRKLRKEGVKVKIGHKKAHIGGQNPPNMVIYSASVHQTNPELEEARKIGIRPLSYAQTIGCLTEVYTTVAVAGSHGKSTTTALTGLALRDGKLDPNIIVGTNLKELKGTNFRFSAKKLLVLEADEWDRSFLHYHPDVAVVTNIDREHLDIYKNLADVKKTFVEFLSRAKPGGAFVLNRDDNNLYSLHSPVSKIAKSKGQQVYWYSLKERDAKQIRRIVNIPGEHNVSNALAAYTVATKVFGVKKSIILRSIGNYRGAWRRMEFRGKSFLLPSLPPTLVYDDYAHHPTEIKATLKAFKEKYPHSPLICVYQPHQAKRLQALYNDFVNAFALADILILIPTYEVAGRDKIASKFTSEKLASAIKKKYPKKEVHYLATPKNLKYFVSKTLSSRSPSPSPVLVMMGAGNIVNYTRLLL